jgi:Putative MetA-pathway of phenol degradation
MATGWKARFAAVLLAASSFLVAAAPATAGHPLETDDPGTQGRRNLEAEFNADRSNGPDGSHATVIYNTDTLGLAPRLDLIANLPYVFDKADASAPTVRGMGDVAIELKYRFLDQKGPVPAFAFKAGALLPTGDFAQGLGDGRASGLFTAIAGWERDNVGLYGNLRYALAGRPVGSSDRRDRLLASVAARAEIVERLVALGECVWEAPLDGGTPRSEVAAGLSIEIVENLFVNGATKWGTTSVSPNVTFLLGVTYDFRDKGSSGTPGN